MSLQWRRPVVRHNDRCPVCDEEIAPEDPVECHEDEWCHAWCAEDLREQDAQR